MNYTRINWEEVWKGFLLLVAGVAFAVGVTALTADHKVDGYYMSRGGNNSTDGASCIWAHWNWHGDEKVYCSDDITRVVQVYKDIR